MWIAAGNAPRTDDEEWLSMVRWLAGGSGRRLNELEQERAKLKRLVSKLSIEKVVLKDIAAEPSCQH
jgi:hypothetical protein